MGALRIHGGFLDGESGVASRFQEIQTTVSLSLKPIFHCYAKPFALGTFALPNANDSTFALTYAKSFNMLVSFALGDANFPGHLTQNHQLKSVEYRLRWVPNANLAMYIFFFFVDFIRVG